MSKKRYTMGERLYSLPTIYNDLPATAPYTLPVSTVRFELHEDEWRQVEFVSASLADGVQVQLERIQQIQTNQNVNFTEYRAYREVYLREGPAIPIINGPTLRELTSILPMPEQKFGMVTLMDEPLYIRDGFAQRHPSTTLYGLAPGERVQCLCIHRVSRALPVPPPLIAAILQLTQQCNLLLVDWCEPRVVHPELEELEQYFNFDPEAEARQARWGAHYQL